MGTDVFLEAGDETTNGCFGKTLGSECLLEHQMTGQGLNVVQCTYVPIGTGASGGEREELLYCEKDNDTAQSDSVVAG